MKAQQGITWKTLIDDLKRFLLLNPKSGSCPGSLAVHIL